MSVLKRKPKNGKFWTALLVGGEERFGRDLLHHLAARQGVLITHRWHREDKDKLPYTKRAMPDVDLALVVKDSYIAQNTRNALFNAAKKSGAFALRIPANLNEIVDDLGHRGFEGDAVEIPEPEPVELPAQEEKEEPREPRRIIVAPAELPAPPPPNGKYRTHDKLPVDLADLSAELVHALIVAGEKLQDARKKLGLTQVAASNKLGIMSSSYLGLLEKGKCKPSKQVCSFLEVFYKLPAGTIPRLALRENHQVKETRRGIVIPDEAEQAHAPSSTVPGGVSVPLLPADPPVVNPFQQPKQDPNFIILMRQLHELKREMMYKYGVKRIEITRNSITVEDKD